MAVHLVYAFPPMANGDEGKLTLFAEDCKFGPDRRVTLLRLRRPHFKTVKQAPDKPGAEGETALVLERVERQAELTICGMPYLHVVCEPPPWWDWSPVHVVPASEMPPPFPPNVNR